MIYAIGDIHGQKSQLDRALELIADDGGPDAQIVFLGDYTDRGPDSRGIIQTLIDGLDAGKPWHTIKGNHDKMFHDFVTQGAEHDDMIKSGLSWVNARLGGRQTLASYGLDGDPAFLHPANGGLETLTSYDMDAGTLSAQELVLQARDTVPASHVAFLAHLPLTFETEELLFVHAGIRPGVPMEHQKQEDLIWIRDGWLEDTRDHGKLVVHGHTALEHPEHYGNRVNLDGGAGYGRPLVPAVFEGRNCWALTDKGRLPLQPPK
jgi:serine/threonine protein phosphatase 1